MASTSPIIPGPNIVLGTSSHAPPRGPNLLSPVYGDRNGSGLYDAVAAQVEKMSLDALANLEYPDHFTRQIESWSKNHRYLDKNGDELRTAIVGEIAGPEWGTNLRAQGNYFARDGDDFKPIDDKSKIKDTIAITIPTCSSTRMYNTVANQVIVLGQVTSANADEDMRNGRDPIVKNWSKSSKPDSENHDVILLTMLPKYAVPSAAGAPKPKRTAKRKLDEIADDVTPSVAVEAEDLQYPARELITFHLYSHPKSFVTAEDIKLGAHYEPALLEDYGGPYFNHVKAKLVQLDVRDAKNNLIPPWKFYDALKPGTLILALCSLHCYTMTDDRGKEPKERKIYQINAHTIRVLAESDDYAETRTRPIPPNSAEFGASKPVQRAAPRSFDNFVVPGAPSSSLSSAGSDHTLETDMEDDGKKIKKAKRTR
ncbi:hypothetical protein B0H13DRAFT_2500648 [Mycena leptocephala]|nr:hypothetical protein B0H13DRAFT_2500648 [Mycena leptocephala]